MANEQITLMARARQLGVDGYRRMSTDELKAAIKSADAGLKAPTKGRTTAASNGSTVTKGKSTPAKGRTSPAKGRTKKSTSKSAPAKSTRKATPKRATAAKGAQVKRPTTARGKTKAKASTRKMRTAVPGTRAPLGKINWTRKSNVGTTGKRKEVLDALREHKGDKAAAFKALKRRATKFYPEKEQYEAERMLVWLIGRVAFDYAFKTGQHESASRASYGESTRPADIKRREQRAAASRPRRSRSQAPKAASKVRSKATASKGRRTAPVASRGMTKRKAATVRGRR